MIPPFGGSIDPLAASEQMMDLIARLFPINRSITGDGLRSTLRILAERLPLDIHEVPSGTAVFDWSVPKEWNVRDAYIADDAGQRLVDFRRHNLHLMSYSAPVDAVMTRDELEAHLITLPEQPHVIPYRTSYYQESWAFCLAHRDYENLPPGPFRVRIDSSLEDGHLSYGELLLPGEFDTEVLLSCHVCHPSLANDNLSGIAVATELAARLSQAPHKLSYRFLFIPGTIGSITWLATHEDVLDRIAHGLVLANLGDAGPPTYKRSRSGTEIVDRAVLHVLGHMGDEWHEEEFSPYGYDERQYCSPGIDLPVGCFTRTPHGRYPEYHTSADDLGFVQAESLAGSLECLAAVIYVLESEEMLVNLHPKGEPQLGRRGLYGSVGGRSDTKVDQLALLWVLNLSDGRHSLLDIAERSGISMDQLRGAADALLSHDLLARARPQGVG